MKRLLTLTIMLLFCLSTPVAALAQKPVQKLKGAVRDFSDYNAIFEEIIDQGKTATPDLIALLKEAPPANADDANQHWNAKVTAMNILSEINAQEALDILKDMLENSGSLSAINNAARTIGRIGGNKAYKILEDVFVNAQNLRYDMSNERMRAVIAGMGLCGNKKAGRFLSEAMNNSSNDEMIRIYAAGSLGLLGSKAGLGVATAGLDSDDEYVRLAATRALGLIASSSAVPALRKLDKPDVDYVYRKAAKLSIAQIETEQLSDDNKIVYIQHQLVNHAQITDFVQWGTMRLKKMKTPKAKKALQDLTTDDSPDFKVLKHAAKMRAKTMD
ncbi:MAG: HEAT repeat domain-containing protein [Desulfobacteraceae bacterium]|nr:MAG: HEAT repeat domain-containing protein [Desulfobacteraceae bacterium]